jgi:protein-S-isoprenylcysteine O-methyltransferase Ste14
MDSWYDFVIRYLHQVTWLGWTGYWFLLSRGVKPAIRRETALQRWTHGGPFLVMALLFIFPHHFPDLAVRPFPQTYTTYWIGTGVLYSGLIFSIWARHALGRNWSGTVTVKQDHELIESGPYRWVRHPIYTGLLLGILGSAIAQDYAASFVAFGCAFLGLWWKLLREEAWMRETFGAAYTAYCARTARLVPVVL